jgi:acetyl-CoA decarbonylase/synthase complex subunit delta
MMRMPMMITPGYESSKCKEVLAPEQDIPVWGQEKLRAAHWEMAMAMSLLLAGCELLILYHPKAVEVIRHRIEQLMGDG